MPESPPARSSLGRSLALGLSLTLAVPSGLSLSPTPARAASIGPQAPSPEPHADPKEDPALTEARALYDEGKARFDTFDYQGAVDLWTKAYAKLPEDAAGIRNRLVYNIATAQEKAFELDHDVEHLRRAQMLLESYIGNYKALVERTPESQAEVDKAQERIAVIKERIEAAQKGDTRPPPPIEGEDTEIEWEGGAAPSPDPELLERNRRLADEERKTDKLLIGAYVSLSLGGLFTLIGLSAMAGANSIESQTMMGEDDPLGGEPEDPEDTPADELRGTGYGSLGLGLAGVITGFVLLGVGLDRRKKAKNGTLITTHPMLAPGLAGAGVRVRF
ncbi:MAG: hypothetical protein AAGF11_51825 [Myxococcota bacterium]